MMRDQGGGLVVNLSSGTSNVPAEPGHPLPGGGGLGAAYPTSKAALTQMTAFVGNELLVHDIVVVALDPGYARSESAEILSARIGADPAWAQPVEVAAKAVGHLATCSDRRDYAGTLRRGERGGRRTRAHVRLSATEDATSAGSVSLRATVT